MVSTVEIRIIRPTPGWLWGSFIPHFYHPGIVLNKMGVIGKSNGTAQIYSSRYGLKAVQLLRILQSKVVNTA